MEQDLKILKNEYLSNQFSILIKIYDITIGDKSKFTTEESIGKNLLETTNKILLKFQLIFAA